MELDELKASWQSLDRRVDRLAAMNLALLSDVQKRKARFRLLPLLIGALLNIAIGGWLASAFARFWIAHLETPSAVIAGVVLQVFCIGSVIMGVMHLLLVTRINFASPVLVIQRYLALLQAWDARAFYWNWLGAWLIWPALLVAGAMALARVDLWTAAPAVVLVNLAAGLVMALLSVLFHRVARRPASRLGAWLDRFLTSHGVAGAKTALAELDRFARE
jgi:hypothetical protein